MVRPDNEPPPAPPRRRLWPLVVTVGVLAGLLAVGGAIALFLATQPRTTPAQKRAVEFARTDPYGAEACTRLDLWMNGMQFQNRDDAWWHMRDPAHHSTTDAIWEAGTPQELHAACVAVGSPIGPYREGPD